MKKNIYAGLAVSAIRKNRRIYVPYILSCVGMVAMYFIVKFLSVSPLLHEMRGGTSAGISLTLGKFVIAVFSVIFLFYTSSFLIKNRYREFGLYSVLGMDKRGIVKIIAWESLIVSAVGIVFGTLLGIAVSKLAELGLVNAIRGEVDYSFRFSWGSVLSTVSVFVLIFFILFIRSLIQVRKSDPIELLRTSSVGEKPPKANYLAAIFGVILLSAAYYLAVSIKSPLTAILVFFVAVIMVVIATYLLFISGSVVLCRLLEKNKKYYYNKNHFVSVSSMKYRMKRNGAGLASICILSTMVLVMITSTGSLYIGENDSLRKLYPRENYIIVGTSPMSAVSSDLEKQLISCCDGVFSEQGIEPKNEDHYRFAETYGLIDGNSAELNCDYGNVNLLQYDNLRVFLFIDREEYENRTGNRAELSGNEALIFTSGCRYRNDTIDLRDVTLNIVGKADGVSDIAAVNSDVSPTILFVVSDLSVLAPLEAENDDIKLVNASIFYGFDLDADDETSYLVFNRVREAAISAVGSMRSNGYSFSSGCMAEDKYDFFASYGGLFFIGIILSIIFIFAAAMIIYYKQVTEGYEDRARFSIMQKLGMTKDDIRKNINSQILTVFFAPLIFAGLHLVFAFPLIYRVLKLFQLDNLPLTIAVNVGFFLIFGLFYALIYKVTAKVYFSIISSEETQQ